MDFDHITLWYHGSPLELTSLRTGSTITQDRDLARVFSHKPSLVSQDTDERGERQIKHSGRQPDLFYRIDEPILPGDIYPHPQSTIGPGQEWLTTRPLRLALIEPTLPQEDELLNAMEIEALLARLAEQGISR
jgi:hypothetical protein